MEQEHVLLDVVVVDRNCFVRPDPRTGDMAELTLAQLLDLLRTVRRAEVTARPAVAVTILPHRSPDGAPSPVEVGLVTPALLRVDAGRVLAWDRVQACYVELDERHLTALSSYFGTGPGADPDLTGQISDLVKLGLLSEHPSHAEGNPTLNAAAAAATPVELMQRPRRAEPEPPITDLPEHTPAPGPGPEPETASEPMPAPVAAAEIDVSGVPTADLARILAYRLVIQTRRAIISRVRAALQGGDPVDPIHTDPIHTDPIHTDPIHTDPLVGEASQPPLAHAADDVTGAGPVDAPVLESTLARGPLDLELDERVPVIPLYSWGTISRDNGAVPNDVEPVLSIGVLFANARHWEGGRLEETYNFVRVRPDAEEVLAAWAEAPRPAVFVFSDYLWNIDQHLEWSAKVKEISPESICVHGGPSCPKYEDDSIAFVKTHIGVDVAARGEAEQLFCELLEAIGGRINADDLGRLERVRGLTFTDRSKEPHRIVRTADHDRIEDLDAVPSPYLTGEFDELLGVPWRSAAIETNRGCPYGCTFCDWGSAMLSRIRKFDLDRVKAELEWVMEHAAPPDLLLTDANFGIFSRDVEIAEYIADLRRHHGLPYTITVSGMAKNTVKYSVPIMQAFVGAGIGPIAAQSIQTADEQTLKAIRRHNIKLERFDDMAAAFVELGLPLVTDLLMGLPGSTVESFKDDLQSCLERDVTARTMEILLLPNSPMNELGYRQEYEIQVDDWDVVCGSSTYTNDDYEEMRRIRLIYRALEHFGMLRHVFRYLQWEHGVRALDLIHDIDKAIVQDPSRYPLLTFVGRHLDIYTIPPVGWGPFFDEVLAFLDDHYGIRLDSGLATIIELQVFLLPDRGRTFPARRTFDHDFIAYRTARLAGETPSLVDFGPVTVEVDDPADVCTRYLQRNELHGRRESTTSNLFWVGYDWELRSVLMRRLVTNLTITQPVAS